MKTSYLRILPLLLAAVLVAACSSDIAPEEPQNPLFGPTDSDEPVPVEFRVSAQHTGDFTRATESIVQFTSGEPVKVCVSTDGGSNYTGYDFTAAATGQNVALNAPSGDAAKPYFPAGSSSTVKAYAYYPATAAATFTVQDDQTTDNNYKASDLMYSADAPQTITKGNTESANLSMRHLMAQLKITAAAQTGSGLSVNRVLVSAKKSVTFTPASGTATATGDNGDIVALTAAGTGYILIPVQQISNVQIKIETGTAGDAATTATFTFGATDNFEAGNSYPIDLTISAAQLGGTTSISDWNGQQPVNYAPTGDLTIEPISPVTYDNTAKRPIVVVRKAGTDITSYCDLQYFNNTNAGTAIVVAQGKSGTDYEGSVAVATFTINPKTLTDAMVTNISAQTYTRSQIQPTVTVTDGGSTLTLNTHYTVSYGENLNAAENGGTVTVTGTGNYTGSVVKNFTISPKSISSMTVTPAFTSTPFTGSTITNSVSSVTDGSYTLNAETEYTVGGTTSATNAATSASAAVTTNTMTVTGTGNYTGTKNVEWSISRISPSLSLSPTSLTLTKSDATKNITVTHNGGGTISASSNATDVASVGTISGTSVPVTGKANGVATITVQVAQSQNYSADSKTVSVSCTGFIDVMMNPLYYVAQYNMTSASAMASTDNAGYFCNWSTAMSNFAASSTSYSSYSNASKSISGQSGTWHLPVQAEWWSIVPGANTNIWGYVSSSSTTAYRSAYITPKWGYNSTTKAGVSESSWFKYISATELHAIRFLGTDYCSAWKWVWSGSTLTISATLIGSVANSESAASAWYSSNWSSVTWGNNDSKGAVQRSFYARGYASSSHLSSGTASSASNNAGSNGYYWSATELNSSYAWYLFFGSGCACVSNLNKSGGFSVRLFLDN